MERLDKRQYSPVVLKAIKEIEDYIENNDIEFKYNYSLTFYALELFDHPIVQKYVPNLRKMTFGIMI